MQASARFGNVAREDLASDTDAQVKTTGGAPGLLGPAQ
jgi:hypothetical protein